MSRELFNRSTPYSAKCSLNLNMFINFLNFCIKIDYENNYCYICNYYKIVTMTDAIYDRRIEALSFINKERSGLVIELIEKISEKIFKEFLSVGFIICGYTPKAETWRISKLGEEYYSELQ